MTALFARDKTPDITSYDLVKTFAVITMLIDHITDFLLPEMLIFKAIGRTSFPVWIFLIGYANTRTIPPRLWGGMILVTLSYVVFHHVFWPLNIFATLVVSRLALRFLGRKFFYTIWGMALLLFVCTVLIPPSYDYIEYGITGVMLAFWAHLRREAPCLEWLQHLYFLIVLVIHASLQSVIFGFSENQEMIAFFGVVAVMMWLHFYFKPVTYSKTSDLPIIAPFLRFCGRYTLEIYTVHIIILTIISAYLYGELQTIDFFGISLEIPAGGFTRK